MNIQAKNLVWINQPEGILECDVLIDNQWTRYAAHRSDVETLGPAIVAAAENGDYGYIPKRSFEQQAPIFTAHTEVDKSKFLTSLVLVGALDEQQAIDAAISNQLPTSWKDSLKDADAKHSLTAKISFATNTKVSIYTDWVQILKMYGVLDDLHIQAAIHKTI